MSAIQIILALALVIFGFWIYSGEFLPWLKGIAWAFSLIGLYFVLMPDKANSIAQILNVGRGADLMLYFFVLIFSFTNIAMYQKIKNLERQVTKLFREKAIKKGKKLS